MTRSFDVFFDLRLNQQLRNNGDAGDFRHHRPHYGVIVMVPWMVAISRFVYSLWPSDAKWGHSPGATFPSVMFVDCRHKPLPKQVLIHHQMCYVAFSSAKFIKKSVRESNPQYVFMCSVAITNTSPGN